MKPQMAATQASKKPTAAAVSIWSWRRSFCALRCFSAAFTRRERSATMRSQVLLPNLMLTISLTCASSCTATSWKWHPSPWRHRITTKWSGFLQTSLVLFQFRLLICPFWRRSSLLQSADQHFQLNPGRQHLLGHPPGGHEHEPLPARRHLHRRERVPGAPPPIVARVYHLDEGHLLIGHSYPVLISAG